MRCQGQKGTISNGCQVALCRLLMTVLVPLLTFLSCQQLASAQQNIDDPNGQSKSDWTFNFFQTPWGTAAKGNKSYSLGSQSETRIAKYQLGCVQFDTKKHATVVYRMEPVETDIGPGEERGTIGFHGNPDRFECEKRNSKLSVVEVTFGNKKEWHAVTEP